MYRWSCRIDSSGCWYAFGVDGACSVKKGNVGSLQKERDDRENASMLDNATGAAKGLG